MLAKIKTGLFFVGSFLLVIFWPISFWQANQLAGLPYFAALALVITAWTLYLFHFRYYYFLFLLLPLLQPGFFFFPALFLLFQLRRLPIRPLILYLVFLVVISVISWPKYFPQSIFIAGPLEKDTLIKKMTLVPNRTFVRIFQNKTTIPLDKFKTNLFVSLDQNHYFFANHPREISDSQNLFKYSYLTLIPFLFGLFSLPKYRHSRLLTAIFVSGALAIAFNAGQDKLDLILSLPITLISLLGLRAIAVSPKPASLLFLLVYLVTSLTEILRFT